MICSCSLANSKACKNCIFGNENVSSTTKHSMDFRDVIDYWYNLGYIQGLSDAQQEVEDEDSKY